MTRLPHHLVPTLRLCAHQLHCCTYLLGCKHTVLSRLLTLSLLLLLLQTPIKDSQAASKAILALDGVVDHGLFLDMVDVCIIAGSNGVEVKERQ
jgi:hypothetical protein